MSIMAMKALSAVMEELNLRYALGSFAELPGYSYFVGAFREEGGAEDGGSTCRVTLDGFTRESWNELLEAANAIRNRLGPEGLTLWEGEWSGGIFFESMLQIPQDDVSLKRLQINLTIKEWNYYGKN